MSDLKISRKNKRMFIYKNSKEIYNGEINTEGSTNFTFEENVELNVQKITKEIDFELSKGEIAEVKNEVENIFSCVNCMVE